MFLWHKPSSTQFLPLKCGLLNDLLSLLLYLYHLPLYHLHVPAVASNPEKQISFVPFTGNFDKTVTQLGHGSVTSAPRRRRASADADCRRSGLLRPSTREQRLVRGMGKDVMHTVLTSARTGRVGTARKDRCYKHWDVPVHDMYTVHRHTYMYTTYLHVHNIVTCSTS